MITENHRSAPSACLGYLVLVLTIVVGCSDPIGSITGVVTYDGKPLPQGRITFLCEGGKRPAVSTGITAGRYAVSALPVGHARVMVETFPPPFASAQPSAPGGLPTLAVPDDSSSPGPYVRIPERYKRPDAAGLGTDIRPGHQTHDIGLEP